MSFVDPLRAVVAGQQFVDSAAGNIYNRQAARGLAAGNYGQALQALGNAGDMSGVVAVQNRQSQQQQAQTDKDEVALAQQVAFSRRATQVLRKALTENQDPVAAYDSLAPAFQQVGATPDQIQQYRQALAADPVNFLTNIERVTAEAERKLNFQKAGNNVLVFEEGNPDPLRTFAAPQEDYTLGQTRFSGATNAPVAQAARPAEYIQVDPTKNLTEIPGSAPVGGGGAAPRGVRNNNPGNIEDGPFARSLPGYKGSDGRFAVFETPQDGVNAGAQLLGSYARRGLTTPAEIINRWAPPSDNNPTQAYAQYVAQRLGIGVNDPIPESRRGEAFQAINEFENGTRGPSQGSAPSGGPRVVAPATARQGANILTAAEKAELGLPAEGVFQRGENGSISQVSGARPKTNKFTEGQRNAAYFYHRLSGASSELAALESRGITRPSPAILAFGEGRLRENALGAEDRQWLQAARNWLSPILRKDTGAAITAGEVIFYMGEYLPSPTDDPATIAQKARSRQRAEASLRGLAGNAYDELFPDVRTNQPRVRFSLSPQQQSWVAQNGRAETSGGVRRRAGSRENPRLINPANATQSYNNIPSGSYFLTPDGQLRQKR